MTPQRVDSNRQQGRRTKGWSTLRLTMEAPEMRRLLAAVTVASLALLAFVVGLGLTTTRRVEQVVTEQFNQQQLAVARQVAQNIEHRFASVRGHLLLLGDLMGRMPPLPHDVLLSPRRCLSCFGLLELRLYHGGSLLTQVPAEGGRDLGEPIAAILAAAPDLGSGQVAVGECFSADGQWLQLMATVVPGDVSDQHPRVLVGVLAPVVIAREAAGPVRSGQTGYCFVLSRAGVFLAHYEDDFVGRDAFTVRTLRNPSLAFDRINRIQAEGMLAGGEDTDWYESGWHRGQTGRIRKLIAYTPAHLGGDAAFWSVAVTAPMAEVQGAIRVLQLRQWTLAGLALLLVALAFGSATYLAVHWSQLLAAKVRERTAALRRSEHDLRVERDRAEENLRLLNEAQNRLIRSERLGAMGEATAKVCHEIKNRLVIIGGFSRQMAKRATEGDQTRARLDIVIEEVRRLESLLAEVSDFTKVSLLERIPVDGNQLIGRLHTMMADQLQERGIELHLSLDRAIPLVFCDPEKLEQVLINLVKNAAEATPQGGTITLATRREPGWVCLDVVDTGAGIPAESLEEIFIPFFTTKKEGSGLGLSVCRKIVQDHGGRIEVKSSLGSGSTFTILLQTPD